MGIKDPFSYSGRWDSVGLDCSNCAYFNSPVDWPDSKKTISCRLHKISLEIELDKSGYKCWEWFCKDFNNVDANPVALIEFESIKHLLTAQILYRAYGQNKELMEYDMTKLRSFVDTN